MVTLLLALGISVTSEPVRSLRPSAVPMTIHEARQNDERTDLLAKAMASARAAIPGAADPGRPAFHYGPPANWMNDPNGPIFYRSWYHLFYQFNPYGDQWGHMHWGHARSRDLVNWEQLPIALWPNKSEGEDHIYSGSTFLDRKDKPTILYTSIGNRAPEQWAATALDSDLLDWTKSPANPVLTLASHGATKIDEWRDPFPFHAKGPDGKEGTYLLLGGKNAGRGTVALYRAKADDLTAWEYLGIAFRHPTADLVECPNIVRIGDRWVLLVSVDGKVEAFTGDLDLTKNEFRTTNRSVLAEGSYASQLMRDKTGRPIHWAWVRMSDRHGWNGCMTLPSTLALDPQGNVIREPIKDLERLRTSNAFVKNATFDGTAMIPETIKGRSVEIVADIDPGRATTVALNVGVSADGSRATRIVYTPATRTLTVPGLPPSVLRPTKDGRLSLHLFLDRTVLDVYANGGTFTGVATITNAPEDDRISVTSEGGEAKVVSMMVYTLAPAKMDLGRFR